MIGTAVDTPEAEWRRVFDVNATGVFLAAQATVPILLKREEGRSSPSGRTFLPRLGGVHRLLRVEARATRPDPLHGSRIRGGRRSQQRRLSELYRHADGRPHLRPFA